MCRVIFLAFFLSILAGAPFCCGAESASTPYLNGGYFLLHKLLADESKLHLLLDLKHAPKEIQDYAQEISQTAKDDLSLLDKIRESNTSVNWDKNPLPRFEQDVRDSIADEKQRQLLVGTKNDDFVRALLVSQAEASNYASTMAKVMAQRSPTADRRQELADMSARWQALNRKDFQLLRNY